MGCFPLMGELDPIAPSAGQRTPNCSGTVLGFDFGAKRIGVAVADLDVGIAHPLTVVVANDKERRYRAIAALISEWCPRLLVVGLPSHMDGVEHAMSRLARKFAAEMTTRFSLPSTLVDERLSSATANMSLSESGVALRKRKPLIDKIAAQQILQSYLDAIERDRPA